MPKITAADRAGTEASKLPNAILGFTGTQVGMSKYQRDSFRRFIKNMHPYEFHHGDCVGSDEEAHLIVVQCFPSIKIVIHPANIGGKRAYAYARTLGDHLGSLVIYPERPPLERDRDMVGVVDTLFAAPRQTLEARRSGTWATIRYMQALSKPVAIFSRDRPLCF